MSVVMTSFNNDESARPPTLLRTKLIGQADKFQNSYFKEYLVKDCYCFTKSMYFKSML